MIESVANANGLAHAIVWLWFPLVFLAYRFMRPTTATCWAIIGGALILPEQVSYDLPLIPPITKRTVPYYAGFAALLLFYRPRLMAAKPLRGVDRLFLLMSVGYVGTVLTNGDPTGFGKAGDYGLKPYDILVEFTRGVVTVYIPFLMGRAIFRDERDLRDCLQFMAMGALICTPFALYETVMNPIVHKAVYGFRCVDFRQAMRMGGYRPSVMMIHGLIMARYFLMALIAAITLWRARQRIGRIPSGVGVAILLVMVVAARSTGAWVIAALIAPVAMFGGAKVQRRTALMLGSIVIMYPLLFATQLFPTEALIDFGYSISEERGTSLEDRFEQEVLLNKKVSNRPIFGWGGYSRAHEFDPISGEDITVVDGEWLILFSEHGAVGFISWFGLYLAPLWLLYREFRRLRGEAVRMLFAGAGLAVAAMAVDMLVNSTGSNPQFFFVGVFYGAIRGAILKQTRERRAQATETATA